MKHRKFILLALLLFTIASINATNALIWKKENPTAHITIEETGQVGTAADAISTVLTRLEIDNIITTQLEGDLSQYDFIVVSMGTFCES